MGTLLPADISPVRAAPDAADDYSSTTLEFDQQTGDLSVRIWLQEPPKDAFLLEEPSTTYATLVVECASKSYQIALPCLIGEWDCQFDRATSLLSLTAKAVSMTPPPGETSGHIPPAQQSDHRGEEDPGVLKARGNEQHSVQTQVDTEMIEDNHKIDPQKQREETRPVVALPDKVENLEEGVPVSQRQVVPESQAVQGDADAEEVALEGKQTPPTLPVRCGVDLCDLQVHGETPGSGDEIAGSGDENTTRHVLDPVHHTGVEYANTSMRTIRIAGRGKG